MRILLIESDLHLCAVLSFELEGKGFAVDICNDAEEGLYYILQDIHDIILLDQTLLTKSVTQVLLTIRKENVQIPIILFTSSGQSVEELKGLALCTDDYIVKPFHANELLDKISNTNMRLPSALKTQVICR